MDKNLAYIYLNKGMARAIKQIRQDKKISREEVAEKLGISTYMLTCYEGYRPIPLDVLEGIISILDVTVYDMFDCATEIIENLIRSDDDNEEITITWE